MASRRRQLSDFERSICSIRPRGRLAVRRQTPAMRRAPALGAVDFQGGGAGPIVVGAEERSFLPIAAWRDVMREISNDQTRDASHEAKVGASTASTCNSAFCAPAENRTATQFYGLGCKPQVRIGRADLYRATIGFLDAAGRTS